MGKYVNKLIADAKEKLNIDEYIDIEIEDFGSFILKFDGERYLRDLKAEILDMILGLDNESDELEVYIEEIINYMN